MVNTHVNEEPSGCCLICRDKGARALEFDRPAVLLCRCDRCGDYIVRKETFLKLARKAPFNDIRREVSGLIQNHFSRYRTPLQIISYTEKPLVQDAITIDKLISRCRSESSPTEAFPPGPEFRPDKRLNRKPIIRFRPFADPAMHFIRNCLNHVFSNISSGRHRHQGQISRYLMAKTSVIKRIVNSW
jgi:hypothetical protein